MIVSSIPIVVASVLQHAYNNDTPTMGTSALGVFGLVLLAIVGFYFWKVTIFVGLRSWLLYRLINFYRGVLFSAHNERVRVFYRFFHSYEIEITCAKLDFTLALYPFKRWWDPFPECNFIAPEIPIFQNRFFCYSNQDAKQVLSLLNAKVQQQLQTMDSLFSDGSLTVVMRRRRLFVEVKTKKMSFPQLRQLIFECCVLVRILQDGTATLVDSVASKSKLQLKPGSETECQICGLPLESQLVSCSSCHTLHHKDCWEYYGECSTYGCGEQSFQIETTQQKVI